MEKVYRILESPDVREPLARLSDTTGLVRKFRKSLWVRVLTRVCDRQLTTASSKRDNPSWTTL